MEMPGMRLVSGPARAALALGSLVILAGCSATAGAKSPEAPAVPDGTPAALGRQVFVGTCAGCHGLNARGMGIGMGPDLVEQSDWLQKQSPADLAKFLNGGGHQKLTLTDEQFKNAAEYVVAIRKK